MPLTRRIRSRGGVNTVVTAQAEVLFTPGGEISRWNNSLSQRVRRATANAAPSNKRPRWAHYGKPLKRTIKASSDIQPRNGGGVAYAAVGSSAPYALYVDQGTNDFNAKILPPWRRFSPSLYEHTWKVPVNAGTAADGRAVIVWEEVGTIRVSGQHAQRFFAQGLLQGMGSLGLARGVGYRNPLGISEKPFPSRLADYVTTDYNVANSAFRAQLEEWRSWRDSAWANEIPLGENNALARRRNTLEARYRRTQEQRAQRKATRDSVRRERKRRDQENYRRRNGARTRDQYDRDRRAGKRNTQAKIADRANFLAAMQKRYGRGNVDSDSLYFAGGRWHVLVKKGGRNFSEVSAPAKFPGANRAPDDESNL